MEQNTINKLFEKNTLLESEIINLKIKLRKKNTYIKHLLRVINDIESKKSINKIAQEHQMSIYDLI